MHAAVVPRGLAPTAGPGRFKADEPCRLAGPRGGARIIVQRTLPYASRESTIHDPRTRDFSPAPAQFVAPDAAEARPCDNRAAAGAVWRAAPSPGGTNDRA